MPSALSPWKAYGDVLGLNAPPRSSVAPGCLHRFCHLDDLLLRLDRARTRDNLEIPTADFDSFSQIDNGRFRMKFLIGRLIRLLNSS